MGQGFSLEDSLFGASSKYGVGQDQLARVQGMFNSPATPAPVQNNTVTALQDAGLQEIEPQYFQASSSQQNVTQQNLTQNLQNAGLQEKTPQTIDDWGQQYRPTTYNESTGQTDYGVENFSSVPVGFNWKDYISKNPDLAQAGIDTEVEAKRHYVQFGAREDRQGAPAVSVQDAINFAKTNVTNQNAFMDGGEAGFVPVSQAVGKYTITPTGDGSVQGYKIGGTSGKTAAALPFAPAGTNFDQVLFTDKDGKVTGSQLNLKTGGDSGYYVNMDASGKITGIENYDDSESWRKPAAMFASFLGATIGLPAIGSALGATGAYLPAAVGGATLGGLNAAIMGAEGSDILKAAAVGGAGGALGAGIGDKLASQAGSAVTEALGDSALSRAAGDIASGAVKGGVSAIPKALVTEDLGSVGIGALTGAGSKLVSGLAQEFAGSSPLGNLTERQINAGINLIRNYDSGNTAALVNNLAELSGSKDAVVAARAGTALNALASGKPNVMFGAIMQLSNIFGGQGGGKTAPRASAGTQVAGAGSGDFETSAIIEPGDMGGTLVPGEAGEDVDPNRVVVAGRNDPVDLLSLLDIDTSSTGLPTNRADQKVEVEAPRSREDIALDYFFYPDDLGESTVPAGQKVDVMGRTLPPESVDVIGLFDRDLGTERVQVTDKKLPPDDITAQSVDVEGKKYIPTKPATETATTSTVTPPTTPPAKPTISLGNVAKKPTTQTAPPRQDMSYITDLPLYQSVFYQRMQQEERQKELARMLQEQENADPYERLMALAEQNPGMAVNELMKIVEGD